MYAWHAVAAGNASGASTQGACLGGASTMTQVHAIVQHNMHADLTL